MTSQKKHPVGPMHLVNWATGKPNANVITIHTHNGCLHASVWCTWVERGDADLVKLEP